MIRSLASIVVWLLISAVSGAEHCKAWPQASQSAHFDGEKQVALVRIASIGFVRPNATKDVFEASLTGGFERDERVSMIPQSQLQAALTGVGYDGSINLTLDEARRVGAAIGCDFFIIGKSEVLARSESKSKAHQEALVGVMIVHGPSGALALFDLIIEKAATVEVAINQTANRLKARAARYVDRMIEFRAAHASGRPTDQSPNERIEDIPEEGSLQATGFKQPEMLNRVKPEYTDEADRADISATVEASVVFLATGEVGEVKVTRWAGFGLDEAAVRAIRQLKFKPATRDGQPINVRAVVRYNFRRINESEAKPLSKPEEN